MQNSLTHLTFGYWYSREIKENILPESLTHLELSDCFNRCLNNCLPLNLKYLKLGKNFNQPLDFLPESLEIIELHQSYKLPLNNLPVSTKVKYYSTRY